MYNRNDLKVAAASAIGSLVVSNMMLLYPGMSGGFVSMVFASGITTPIYYYSLIPSVDIANVNGYQLQTSLVPAFDYKGAFANFTGAKQQVKVTAKS